MCVRKNKIQKGFTLLESLFAIVLVALAVTALLVSTQSFTSVNAAGVDMSTAEFLIEQVRELSETVQVIDPDSGTDVFGAEESALADYDDLDDFNGQTFSPPIDITRTQLADFSEYSQKVSVQNVSSGDFSQTVTQHASPYVRVRVDILKNQVPVSSLTWIRSR